MKHFIVALMLLHLGLTVVRAQDADPGTLAAQGTTALAAKNWQEAESIFKRLVALQPTNWEYQQNLISAQIALQHYDDALASSDKAIASAQKGTQASAQQGEKTKAALGGLLTTKGNILLKQKKIAGAIAMYEKAAAISADPAIAYFNICALLYNQGLTQEVVPACDKAIAADPAKADAYYIKGSTLFGDATIENGKMVAPAASVQALQKYLELAPSGSHAADVKAMLSSVGQPIETTYDKRKGK